MIKHALYVACFLFSSVVVTAGGIKDSLHTSTHLASSPKRVFKEVDAKIALKEAFSSGKNYTTKSNLALLKLPDSIESVAKKIFSSKNLNFVEKITGIKPIDLPIGLKGMTSDGFGAELVIVKAKVTPQYLELTAFAKLQTQFSGVELYFAADGLKLSHDGGIVGSWKLHLLSNKSLPQLGGKMLFTILGSQFNKTTGDFNDDNNSYIEFDCDGFKNFEFTADIRLSRSLVVPVGANGKRIAYDKDLSTDGYKAVGNSNYVGVAINLKASSWSDLLLKVSLPNFELTKLEKWTFSIQDAVYDMSDLQNSSTVVFPEIYATKNLFPGGNKNAWKGFYASKIKVILPPEFKNNNADKRTEFDAENLMLDNLGVSGNFKAKNILDKGSATGWQFRVDEIAVKIDVNILTSGSFKGAIKPGAISSYLDFDGLITPETYRLTVKVDQADMNMFKGKLVFKKDSWVKMEVDKEKEQFRAEAFLNGWLNISETSKTSPTDSLAKGNKINFNGIVFQNLHLKSYEKPFIKADYFGFPNDAKLGSFPVSFENIHLVTPTDDIVGIAFKMKLNLMDKSGLYADTSLQILGKFTNESFHSYTFDKVKMDEITIDVEKSGFRMFGQIGFFDNDPTYGNGFRGEVNLELKNLNIAGKAKALFANKDFRYWFADFQIDNSTTSKSPLKIQQVVGGLSYKMKRVDGAMAWSYSNSAYAPDAKSGWGLRAGAKATFGQGETFKAKLFLELQYNSNGGLNRLYFLGEGALMSESKQIDGNVTLPWSSYGALFDGPEGKELTKYLSNGNLLKITKRAHPVSEVAKDGKIGLFVSIEKDFEHDTFDGLFEAYLKLQGLKGSGENNKFGMVHLYSSPNKSYLHVGTPVDKLGAIFKIGIYDVNVGAYFMTGDVIPSQIPPHPRVLEILGPDIMNDNRDLSLLDDARGFAFGLNFAVQWNADFSIFYARIEAGGGFDIMHRKLNGVSCAGRPGLVGNDGWYSMGQVYAYIYGEMGIKVKLFLIERKFKILEAGVAAMFRGEFPNPTHMEGFVGVSYNVLGGLIKGRVRFKVELGEKCDFIGLSDAVGIAVIADVKPDGDTNVDVFKIPQVAFNFAVNQPFTIESPSDGRPKSVRIKLKTLSLKTDGQEFAGKMEWADNNTKLNFITNDILPPNKQIDGFVEVNFEEKIGGNWVIMSENGVASSEKRPFSFTTGSAPDYIPIENVRTIYPIPDTKNCYPNDYKTAYLTLKRGQDYLFTGDNAQWSIKGEVLENKTRKSQNTVAYDTAKNKLSFAIDNLATAKKYKMSIVAYAPGVDATATTSVASSSPATTSGQVTTVTGEEAATVTNAQASAGSKSNVSKSLLDYAFGTSKFNTFVEKVEDLKNKGNIVEIIYSDVHAIHYLTKTYEVFNEAELYGTSYTDSKPLITAEAILDDAYYTQKIYPLIYQNYPLDGTISLTNRNPNNLGFPPAKSIDIPAYYRSYLQQQPNSEFVNQRLPFRYNLPLAYKKDFVDLQYQAVNRYLSPTVNWEKYNQYRYLINGTFPFIPKGNYKVKLTYTLNEGAFSTAAERLYNVK